MIRALMPPAIAALLALGVVADASGSSATTPAATPARSAPRRLEDIHIEGQLPAPQVLFITARDQRRFVEFQHARYLRDARTIGAAVRMPRRFLVSGAAPSHAPEMP